MIRHINLPPNGYKMLEQLIYAHCLFTFRLFVFCFACSLTGMPPKPRHRVSVKCHLGRILWLLVYLK